MEIKDRVGYLERYSYQEKPGSVKLSSKPKNSAGGLTSRLVMATNEQQVRTVVTDAHSEIAKLRLIVALGDSDDVQKAQVCIGKLEKLIGRAKTKIKDLRSEANVKRQQRKAEENQETEQAEQIKEQLRKKRVARGTKENGYLIDARREDVWEKQKGGCGRGFWDAGTKLDLAGIRPDDAGMKTAVGAEASASTEAAAEGGLDIQI